jgi:hypothetical protein
LRLQIGCEDNFNIFEELIRYVKDKITTLINIEPNITCKSIVSICHTELFGLHRLLTDLKSLLMSNSFHVYLSQISLNPLIFKKEENLNGFLINSQRDECLVFLKASIFDFNSRKAEIQVEMEANSKFLWRIKRYKINEIAKEERVKRESVLGSKLDELVEPADFMERGKNPYLDFLERHIQNITDV